MTKYKVLYNPMSNNKRGEIEARSAKKLIAGAEVEYVNLFEIDDIKAYIASLDDEDKVVLCGGDGTLNHFINDIDFDSLKNDVFFYATGTGNDFLRSIGAEKGNLIRINDYARNLPIVTVKGKDYKFINGVGFGIDGYCCEVGDKMKEKTDKPINYTGIAIKGLLFHFKPFTATITVDGNTETFSKVWLVPTMYGSCYGGGMFPTPDQKRGEGIVSLMVYYGKGKIKSLMVFPSIFKGEHVNHTDMVKVFTGKEITVKADRPISLQVDGDTILNVTEYTVRF